MGNLSQHLLDQVLGLIDDSVGQHGASPLFATMAEAVQKHPDTIVIVVRHLRQQGLISHSPTIRRTYIVTPTGQARLAQVRSKLVPQSLSNRLRQHEPKIDQLLCLIDDSLQQHQRVPSVRILSERMAISPSQVERKIALMQTYQFVTGPSRRMSDLTLTETGRARLDQVRQRYTVQPIERHLSRQEVAIFATRHVSKGHYRELGLLINLAGKNPGKRQFFAKFTDEQLVEVQRRVERFAQDIEREQRVRAQEQRQKERHL